jgi:phosphatidylserine/phosphatidylglycerophosphate/cardiolipin synthase-like enzyme
MSRRVDTPLIHHHPTHLLKYWRLTDCLFLGSCVATANESFVDAESDDTDADHEGNAEDDNDASFLACPVAFGELVGDVANLDF